MRVRAIERHDGRSARNELTFKKGDLLLVLEADESLPPGWLQGIHEDRIGIFPEIKVQPIPDVVLREVGAMGVARRTTQSTEDELGMTEGELIFVERELEGGWSEGHLVDNESQRGIFLTEDVLLLEEEPTSHRTESPRRNSPSLLPRQSMGPQSLDDYGPLLRKNVVGDSSLEMEFGNMRITDFVSDPIQAPERLPDGWQVAYFPNGNKFYIDHNTRSTSWTLPSHTHTEAAQPPYRPPYQPAYAMPQPNMSTDRQRHPYPQ